MPKTSKYDRMDVQTLAELIDTGRSIVEELRDELDEVLANLEERFSNTSRFETLSTTRDALGEVADDICSHDLDEIVPGTHEFSYRVNPRASRADRRSDAVERLSSARDIISEEISERAEGASGLDELEEISDMLERWIDTLEACEFPGIRG